MPKNRLQHGNKLVRSSPDDGALAAAVEDKFLDLCTLHQRLRGADLPIPVSLNPDILRWRQMCVRHKSADFRHTEGEMKSVKAIAEWTLRMKSELTGEDIPIPDWQ